LIKSIIFDLDGTLVDSSALDVFRQNRQWGEINRNLKLCSLYTDVSGLLNTARAAGIKISVFTNSPKQYAKSLLSYFNIKVDYIVAYNDVRNKKPSSEGISKILDYFKVHPNNTVLVGNSLVDKDCAYNAGIEYYSVEWGDTDGIEQKFIGLNHLKESIGKSLKEATVTRSNLIVDGNKLFLGYYLDGIKSEVWSYKDGKKDSVSRWTSKTLEVADSFPEVNYVVRALGHAELKVETNNKPLDETSAKLASKIGAKYLPNLLSKKKTLKKSTSISGAERANQIKGVYTLSIPPILNTNENPKFLVVDDVYTSGATTGEITRAIVEAFPNAQVYIFTLVKTLYRTEVNSDSREFQHNGMLFFDLYNSKVKETNGIQGAVLTQKSNKAVKKLTTKKFSANYTNTNHNFVIQNLSNSSISSSPANQRLFSIIQVAKNILQRGKPTIASRKLRVSNGLALDQTGLELEPLPLISNKPIYWNRIIRGHSESNSYPAKYFFEELLEKYLGKYGFIKQLTVPEVQIFDMTQLYVEQFQNRQVDFFIPHVGVIIEIDGPHHQEKILKDHERDIYTKQLGIETFRFTSDEVSKKDLRFKDKMSELYSYIKKIDNLEKQGVINPPNGISLEMYRKQFNKDVDLSEDVRLRLTASCRFQLLILELLERGTIHNNRPTSLTVINQDNVNFIEHAVNDLAELIDHLSGLADIDNLKLQLDIEELHDTPTKRDASKIIIDFSILQRFDDQNQLNPDIIYVRTDYFDFYRHFPASNANSIEQVELDQYDNFTLSCAESVKYNLDLSPSSSQRESLRYFLSNIFLPTLENVDFREGQVGIIGSALSKNSTIGLLPTGSGKSICYQLSALLQPGISFVVCPIKSLMYDQKIDLDSIGFTRSNYITSELNPSEKARIQREFGRGKYFFVFISPERFQTMGFRNEMNAIGKDLAFAYAVIDEAHCLSEWGHDFRTAYLNLANTIENFAPSASYIGLTATASINVLKDIQTEFNIPDDFVRTPLNFSRDELSFHVINDRGNKHQAVKELVTDMEQKWNPKLRGASKAGIIFTPTVNGNYGCYNLSCDLSTKLNMDVRYYSGSKPSDAETKDFDEYKRQVQKDFKENKYNVLAATKAFGMGVNKGNVAYTIHFGIPGSMEALYQEAGRAGRDKKQFVDMPADCYVLITPEKNSLVLEKIWDQSTTIPDLKKSTQSLGRNTDLNTNMFLMTASMDTIRDESHLIYSVYQYLKSQFPQNKFEISASEFNVKKSKLEKAIYRLSQLGAIDDWVIEDFFNGIFTVYLNSLDVDVMEKSLEVNIQKYEVDFQLQDVFSSTNTSYVFVCKALKAGKLNREKFVILILLIWSYEHFVYNRRQSQKNVYEQCLEVTRGGALAEEQFKARLEGYFKHDKSSQRLLHIAENTTNTHEWLSIFYIEQEDESKKQLLSREELTTISSQISRFLESYKENPSLDYLSGVSRLISDQFDDTDGKLRMSLAFDKIIPQDFDSAITLVNETLELGSELFSDDAKCDYARLVHEKFNDEDILIVINRAFKDAYSQRILLTPLMQRLETLTKRYDGVEW
jgi:ATP-dependent DNA helicase RecQ